MEAQTTVSNSTQCGLFISEYKKYTVSGVTFSFKDSGCFPMIMTRIFLSELQAYQQVGYFTGSVLFNFFYIKCYIILKFLLS